MKVLTSNPIPPEDWPKRHLVQIKTDCFAAGSIVAMWSGDSEDSTSFHIRVCPMGDSDPDWEYEYDSHEEMMEAKLKAIADWSAAMP